MMRTRRTRGWGNLSTDPQALLDDVGPASIVEMGTLVADLG